jgi:hypothetical protein
MPIGDNGTSLAERLMPQALSNAAARFVDSLKINSISEAVRRGRRMVIKRRNVYGEKLADLANLYFRMSGIPIRFWSKAEEWRRWEASCFRMLNGDRFRSFTSGPRKVCLDKLPGKSLWEYLNEGTVTRRMLEAAGTELRRAHQFWSDEFHGPWSHGDSTATNVIYNQKTDRARLIDFEIVHDRSLPAKSRHADDLLVFLLDVIATASSRQWMSFALSFLNAYGDPTVLTELTNHLAVPGGIAWIWWGVRTSFTNPAKVKQRLERIRDVTANLEHHRAFAAKRARHRRRASISCQAITPGIPIAKSRKRAIKEMAKAVSPGM